MKKNMLLKFQFDGVSFFLFYRGPQSFYHASYHVVSKLIALPSHQGAHKTSAWQLDSLRLGL